MWPRLILQFQVKVNLVDSERLGVNPFSYLMYAAAFFLFLFFLFSMITLIYVMICSLKTNKTHKKKKKKKKKLKLKLKYSIQNIACLKRHYL